MRSSSALLNPATSKSRRKYSANENKKIVLSYSQCLDTDFDTGGMWKKWPGFEPWSVVEEKEANKRSRSKRRMNSTPINFCLMLGVALSSLQWLFMVTKTSKLI